MSSINLNGFKPASHIVISESGIPIAVIKISKKQEHEVSALIEEAVSEHTGDHNIIDIELSLKELVVYYEGYKLPAIYEAYPIWLYE